MINFRYHIVSLMAVFLALSVGIAAGVSLGPSVDETLNAQAALDRRQVAELRAELTRRDDLDRYRETWESRVGTFTTAGALNEARVAVVSMPDAPSGVVQSVTTAITTAGGTVVRDVQVNDAAFDPASLAKIDEALASYKADLQITDSTNQATKVGMALGKAVASKNLTDRDANTDAIGKALTTAGVVSINGDARPQAQLLVVVTAAATEPAATADVQSAHVQFDVELRRASVGLVLAGPNSDGLDGTDVLAARSNSLSADTVSTVDVVDLSSGVATVVLAAREQLAGDQGHYGALARADAPLPTLPPR